MKKPKEIKKMQRSERAMVVQPVFCELVLANFPCF